MTHCQIWTNLAALAVLIALLGFIYWTHTGERAVPGLIEDLQSEDRQAQQLATAHLKEIGLAAKPAVPLLVELATSAGGSLVQSEAAGALQTIDLTAARQVMTYHLPKLQDPDARVRREAASLVGALGPVAKPAVSSLLRTLKDPEVVVRDQAVRALGAIGLPADEVSHALTEALRDPDWTVRYAAIMQFTFGGFSGPEALAALRELTNDSNQTVARSAESAVAAAEHPLPISALVNTLDQPVDRSYALLQLAKLGPKAAEAVPKLTVLLSATRPLERYLAANTLESIGHPARQALPALEQAEQDPDPVVRESIAHAIQTIARESSATP